jgi:hypothetical protein
MIFCHSIVADVILRRFFTKPRQILACDKIHFSAPILHSNIQSGQSQRLKYTPLAVVLRTRKTLRVLTTATIAQILAVSSKEGAVIGAVLSMRKFHRGHH